MAIGDLVVNLIARTRQFTSPLSGALNGLRSFASSATGILAGVGVALSASASIDAARVQLQAEQKLAAVIQATGGAAGLTAGEIAGYAAELQKVTNFGDEVTIGAASMLATFKEIKGDVFKEALVSAQDLSTVMGQDLKSSIVQIGKALNDPAKGVTALQRVGVSFTQQQKDQIKALQESGDLLGAQTIILKELKGEFGGASQALADPWTQLKNTIGDVMENLGFVLLPIIGVVSQQFTALFGIVSGGTTSFKDVGIEAAVFLQSMGGLLVLGLTQWQLFFVQLAGDAAHLFTATIPAYLSWLGSNWANILKDIGNFHLTLYSNITKNLMAAWDWIVAYVAGKPFEGSFTPLLDGFKSTVSQMPDVPARAISEMEQSLMRDIDGISEHLATEAQKTRDEWTRKLNPTDATVPALAKIVEEATPAALAAAPPTLATPEVRSSTSEPGFAAALTRGSSEAISALNKAAFGGSRSPNAKLETINKQQLTVLNKIATSLDDQADAADEELTADFGWAG